MVYFFRRFFAYYVDGIIVFILTFLTYFFIEIIEGISLMDIRNPSMSCIFFLSFFMMMIYFGVMDYFFHRTLGKILFKLEIEGYQNSDKKTLIKKVFFRNIARLIPFDPFSILLNESYRTWHDLIAKTKVIDVRKKYQKGKDQ